MLMMTFAYWSIIYRCTDTTLPRQRSDSVHIHK